MRPSLNVVKQLEKKRKLAHLSLSAPILDTLNHRSQQKRMYRHSEEVYLTEPKTTEIKSKPVKKLLSPLRTISVELPKQTDIKL